MKATNMKFSEVKKGTGFSDTKGTLFVKSSGPIGFVTMKCECGETFNAFRFTDGGIVHFCPNSEVRAAL